MKFWLNIISYGLNIAFGLILLYIFAYIAKTGRYLQEPNPFIVYGEIAMSLAILAFGFYMVIRSTRNPGIK